MKKIFTGVFPVMLIMGLQMEPANQSAINGAWSSVHGSVTYTLVFQDGYFSYTQFDILNKKFYKTSGGTFSESGGQLHINIEYDTETKDNIAKHTHYPVSVSGNTLKVNMVRNIDTWTRVDNGTGSLIGNWRITGRMNNGTIQEIPLRARKTLKLISGTRFQWMAINTETKEFSGTGGGTYTFKDGKYTENIEFFSRDSSRVGASLSFEGSVDNKIWTHKGLSSRGEPIHEIWTRENPL